MHKRDASLEDNDASLKFRATTIKNRLVIRPRRTTKEGWGGIYLRKQELGNARLERGDRVKQTGEGTRRQD